MRAEPAYRADGQTCTAPEFYALACDPARSVIVDACAGAGKTWMLVSRIVRALLDDAAPSDILAITFTRKAAGEMRTRLNDWLRDFAEASGEERHEELQRRGLTAAEARRLEPRLAVLHAQVLASGQPVQINTFHAWFAQLLRLAPLELLDALGLHPAMALIEETNDLMGELMRRFQRRVLAAPQLLRDYRALIERHGRWRLDRWLHAVVDKRIEIERADERQALQATIATASERWPDCVGLAHPLQRLARDAALRRQLAAALRQLQAQPARNTQEAATKLAVALDTLDPEAAFALARDALFTKEGPPRKLGDLMEVSFAVDALHRLGEQAAQQDAHDDHERLVGLARVLLECWRALKRERSLIDMPDLERCALALLSDSASAGWVQQRLDVRLRHVLIDEFQDTSNLQWQALQAWLSSYAGAGGGASGHKPLSVFIVGDPKQSIYRFRGAEPRVFDAARRFVVEGLAGHDLACNHTRRNAVAVIDAVNAVFEGAVSAGDYGGFAAHSTMRIDQSPGQVCHLPDPPVPPKQASQPRDGWRDSLTEPRHEAKEARVQDEARRVAQAVLQVLREGVRPEQVMVLARRHASLAPVVEELQALQVPCVAAEALHLADLVEVRDLVDVLDVIASHGNDIALARALKSPLFGASDAELLALAGRADRRAATPWWSALQGWTDAPPALGRAREMLARWATDAAHLPPHDLLDRVVHQGDLMARLGAAVPSQRRSAAFAAVNALLGLSLSLDGGRHASVYRFVRALRQRALAVRAPARDDAVQLLTVHGAKGLEADCVFVVDADPHELNDSEPGVLVDWPVDSDAPRRVAFVADLAAPCVSLADLRAQEQLAAQREELNALYVAMTRARDRLVFSRTPSSRSPRQPTWWLRVQPHSLAWTAQPPAAPAVAAPAVPVRVPDLSVAPDSPPCGTPTATALTEPSIAARLGRAVHRVLQWAQASSQPPDLDVLAAAAAIEFELPASSAAAAAAFARRMLGNPELQRFFDPRQLAWSADEFDLVHDGQLLRVDRLVRFSSGAASTWWVLDYKLATDAASDPALRQQLARYRAAVQSLAGGDCVRAALVTGDGSLHELDAATPTA